MLTSILSLFLLYNYRFSQTMILSLLLALYYVFSTNTVSSSEAGIAFNNTAIYDSLYLGATVTSIIAILWIVSYLSTPNKHSFLKPNSDLVSSLEQGSYQHLFQKQNSDFVFGSYQHSGVDCGVERGSAEILALMLLLLIAISTLSSSNHILAIFVCIELQSLALYILLALHVSNSGTSNHGISSTSRLGVSYLINAAVATAMLLLGLSHSSSLLLVIALLWKLGSIPMHAWMIGIVDSLDISISAIMLTITKLGILISIAIISTYSTSLSYVLLYASIANLIVGSIISMQHYRYVRLLSWLSIAQLGYVLLIIHYSASSTAMLYFELYSIYTIMLLLCYNMPNSNISHMHKQMSTIMLWLLALGLYTVAGIPSAPIFWAKLELLLLTNAQAIVIALIGTILSSLVYVRLIKYANFYSYAIY